MCCIRLFTIMSIFFSALALTSCESEAEKRDRLALELERSLHQEQLRIERETQEKEERAREEAKRLKREEEARQAQKLRDKYINNHLRTGSAPYRNCFGSRNSCDGYDCSEITVKASWSSDVIVTIKRYGKVYRHAYIKSGQTHAFNLPDGTYQPFFYYGRGWNPEKEMSSASCKSLVGGFIEGEHFDKDSPQSLNGQILSYELVEQIGGNFSTKPSNQEEAL